MLLAMLWGLDNHCRAEISTPYKGSQAGNLSAVYLYNVSTGMFLQTNRRDPSFWTTRAQLDVSGKDLILTPIDGGFQIDPRLGNNHSINDFNLYCDTSRPVTTWVFTPVETDDGTYCYTITSGSYTIGAGKTNGADGRPLITNTASDLIEGGDIWQIITTEERLQQLSTATPEHPVDASWMIGGFDFAANDERNESWKGLTGSYAITADNKVSCNRLLEYWGLQEGDVYQELQVPNGTYVVWANACYSPTGASELSLEHLNAYNGGTEPVCGYVYANEEQVPMVSIYAEAQNAKVTNCMEKQIGSYWIPAGNGQVSGSFYHGYYQPDSLYVNVIDEKLRIGAKVVGGTGTSWMLVDNFTLIYLGNEGSAFKGHITPTPAAGASLNFDDIAALSLRMDGASSIAFEESSTLTLTITGSDGEMIAHADISHATSERNVLSITPVIDVINYGGEATISVEGNILVDNEPFVIGSADHPYTFTWNIKAKVLPYIPTFDIIPSNQEAVSQGVLGFITITFPDASNVAFDTSALAAIYDATSNESSLGADIAPLAVSDAFFGDWKLEGNSIMMTFRQMPRCKESARLVVAGGSITVDGRQVDEFEVIYAISDEAQEPLELEIASAVDTEGRLDVAPQNSTFAIVHANQATITRVYDAAELLCGIALPTITASDTYLTIYPTEGNALPEGRYTMTLPEGLFTFFDEHELRLSARQQCTFTVGEGVHFLPFPVTSIVETHATTPKIFYNLQGLRENHPSKGIYLIKGKKIILK